MDIDETNVFVLKSCITKREKDSHIRYDSRDDLGHFRILGNISTPSFEHIKVLCS